MYGVHVSTNVRATCSKHFFVLSLQIAVLVVGNETIAEENFSEV